MAKYMCASCGEMELSQETQLVCPECNSSVFKKME